MPIRQYRPPSSSFVDEFEESLLASPVPLADVIPWNEIESTVETKADILPIFEDENDPQEFFLQEFINNGQAERRCEILFELLQFQDKKLVSREATWTLSEVEFSDAPSEMGDRFATHLTEVEAHRLLQSEQKIRGHLEQYELDEYETNPGQIGRYFEHLVGDELQAIEDSLPETTRLVPEDSISAQFNTGQRAFDYVLYQDYEPQIVFEVKFFQNSSSKIHESIHSFDRLSTKLRSSSIEFVWITDGGGWEDSPEAIEQAYRRIVDIYNYEQVASSLEEDIHECLQWGPAVSEDEVELNHNRDLRDFE